MKIKYQKHFYNISMPILLQDFKHLDLHLWEFWYCAEGSFSSIFWLFIYKLNIAPYDTICTALHN